MSCCDSDRERHNDAQCLKWTILILWLLSFIPAIYFLVDDSEPHAARALKIANLCVSLILFVLMIYAVFYQHCCILSVVKILSGVAAVGFAVWIIVLYTHDSKSLGATDAVAVVISILLYGVMFVLTCMLISHIE